MKLIKIYDKQYNPLTTLTEKDFNQLGYRQTLEKIGDCQFIVRLDRDKITTGNLEHYNRLEILEDGVVKFVGVIVTKTVNIDTALIRCREINYILKKRILPANFVVNGAINAEITDLLNTINADDDTGITAGDMANATETVNTTFNRASAFDIISQITKATGNQFKIEKDNSLTVKTKAGKDLSESVIFQYDTTRVASSNILQFDVEDNGGDIITKVYGESGAFNSTKEDIALKAKYGILEKYRDFRVANTQLVLDDFTEVEVADRLFSPEIKLNPNVEDNFAVGDTVRVLIKNSLISIDTTYQGLEKRVQYNGEQKDITVSINALPESLATKLIDRDLRLQLLEKQV